MGNLKSMYVSRPKKTKKLATYLSRNMCRCLPSASHHPSFPLPPPVQRQGDVRVLLRESGAGQRAQQADAEEGGAEHHRQGHHQLQGRLRAGLRAARAGDPVAD